MRGLFTGIIATALVLPLPIVILLYLLGFPITGIHPSTGKVDNLTVLAGFLLVVMVFFGLMMTGEWFEEKKK